MTTKKKSLTKEIKEIKIINKSSKPFKPVTITEVKYDLNWIMTRREIIKFKNRTVNFFQYKKLFSFVNLYWNKYTLWLNSRFSKVSV